MIPLQPLGKPRDGRYLVYVACDTRPTEPSALGRSRTVELAGIHIYPLGRLADPPRVYDVQGAYELPGFDLWGYLATLSDRLLVVFGDAARDLSLLGEPPGYVEVTRFVGSDHAPHLAWLKYRAKGRALPIVSPEGLIVGWEAREGRDRGIDVMQLGNLHPAGELAHEVASHEAARWLNVWHSFLMDHTLGRMDWTMARQAVRSLRHTVTPTDTIWQHRDPKLHAFEYHARRAQGVTRVSPVAGAYEGLYHLDFNAFYPRIMATYDMPGSNVGYWDGETAARTPDRALVRELLGQGKMVVTKYMAESGAVFMAGTEGSRTALLDSDVRFLRVAAYDRAPVLKYWATRMLTLRNIAPDEIRPAVKALSVALWGRLTQRSYAWRDVTDTLTEDDIDELIDARAVGASELAIDDETLRKMTEDGRVLQSDAAAWSYMRWHAVGVHVLEHARLLMQEAMSGCEVVYAHTDSVYSPGPIPYAESNPTCNGDAFDYEYIEDVVFKGGNRYVGGKQEAHHGTPRPGRRWLWNYGTPGVARWTERGDGMPDPRLDRF